MSSEMDEKIYTERKMLVGVALGGPLAGGYYFWRTLNAFSKPKAAVVAVFALLAVLALIIGSLFIPILDKLPNFIFYGIQFGLVLGVTRGYLLTEMAEHIAAGKAEYGWGNTILVAAVSILMTLGPLIAFIYISPDTFDSTTMKSYGKLKHEIVFDSNNLSSPEVDRVATSLTSAGFFDEEVQKTMDLKKSGEKYILTMYCIETARDPEFIEMCRTLRSDVQRSFPANPIVLDLVIDTPDNRIARLE